MFEVLQRDLDRYGEFSLELQELGNCLVVLSMHGLGECLSVYKLGKCLYKGICDDVRKEFSEDEEYFYFNYNGLTIKLSKSLMYY